MLMRLEEIIQLKESLMFKSILFYIFCVITLLPSVYAETQEGDSKPFLFLESTAYLNKEPVFEYGFIPIEELGSFLFWSKGQDMKKLPTQERICKVIGKVDKSFDWVVLDVEHWGLSTKWTSKEQIIQNIDKYKQFVEMARECSPNFRFGLYGQIPIFDGGLARMKEGSEDLKFWEDQHEVLYEIADVVDAIFPSLYTFSPDPESWSKSATRYIATARRLARGKPVYPYIWPQYHDGSKKRGEFIDNDLWRIQLELIYHSADGLVLWGGWKNGPMQWDDNAEWWQETKKFINSIQ